MISKKAAKWWTIGAAALFVCSLFLQVGCLTWLSVGAFAVFGVIWYLKEQRDQQLIGQTHPSALTAPDTALSLQPAAAPRTVSRQSPGSERLFVPTAREE